VLTWHTLRYSEGRAEASGNGLLRQAIRRTTLTFRQIVDPLTGKANVETEIPTRSLPMTAPLPRTVSRPIQFKNGCAIGISNRWHKGQYCTLLSDRRVHPL
jgi:hypothetical protein